MKNEERIEALNRKASRMVMTGIIVLFAAMALVVLSGVAHAAAPFLSGVTDTYLIGSIYLSCVSIYYTVLLKREKRKVGP